MKFVGTTVIWNINTATSLYCWSLFLIHYILSFSSASFSTQSQPLFIFQFEPDSHRKTLKLKLCPLFFIKFLFFHQMIGLQKLWKMFLISSKISFRSQDIQIFVTLSLPFHTFQIQKDKWKWNNLWRHKLACINLQMSFLE